MRTAGLESVEQVLRSNRRVGGELGVDAADRRAIPQNALLRQAKDGQDAGHRRPTCGTTDAAHGSGGDLPQAASLAERCRTSDLPLFAAECGHCTAEPGMVE